MGIISKKIFIVGIKMIKYSDKITWLGIPFEPLSNLAEGCLNFVFKGSYKGMDSILKIYNQEFEFSEKRFRNELNVLRDLSHLKVPKLIDYSQKSKWILYKFVEGKSLKEKEEKGEYINLLSLVGSLEEIHSVSIDKKEEPYEEYLGNLVANLENRFYNSGLDEPLRSSVNKAIRYLDKEKNSLRNIELCRVVGDLNGSNILIGENGNVESILDWEFSHIGDKYIDIAQFTNREDDFAKEFQERYFNGRMDKRSYDFFLVYFLVKISINNSKKNLEKMAFIRDEKLKIVKSKSKRLMEMF